MTYEEYKKQVGKNSNASMFARDSYSSKLGQTNDDSSYNSYKSSFAFNPDVDTTQGLYKMAAMSGLKDDADRVLYKQGGGESKFFSGGLVSDALDALNFFSYGMVGVMKGVGFSEGVKNRESFADDDSLGKYGFIGKVAGLAADILIDPTTYVAPFKIFAKIPGVAKTLDAAKTLAVGEFKPVIVGEKEYSRRSGGWTPLRLLGDKLVYGYSVDKKYADGIQSAIDKKHAYMSEMNELSKTFAALGDDVIKNIGEFKADGTLGRRSIEELQRTLNPEQVQIVRRVYEAIERNADELVELGALPKSARDKHIDDYLTQTYDEYLDAKKGKGSSSEINLGKTHRERLKLSKEERIAMNKDKGLVTDIGVVVGVTLMKQAEMLGTARLQKLLSDTFGVTPEDLLKSGDDVTKWHQVTDTPQYKINKSVDEKIELTKVNAALHKVLKERRAAFKDSKELTAEIGRLEKYINNLAQASGKNFGEAISGLRTVLKEGGITTTRKKVPTSEGQKALASAITRWLKRGTKVDRIARETIDDAEIFAEFSKTREGLALEKAFETPEMMYQWRSPEEFFNAIRSPQKVSQQEAGSIVKELSEEEAQASIKRAEAQRRKLGELTQVKEVLQGTNLQLVDDLLAKLEDDYADLLFQRSNLLETINFNTMGNLAGKYLPSEVWEMVKGTFEPTKQFGESAVMVFKHAKVLWNPAAYPRNMMGAMIANWWKLGLGPWKLGTYMAARKELLKDGPLIQEMVKEGFVRGTGQVNELLQNYMNEKVMGEAITRTTNRPWKAVKGNFKRFDRWLRDSYSNIDDVAKVAAYSHARKKGVSPKEALAGAYTATFNYAQVTPFVHQMRRAIWGVPFITFNLKAVPLVADTLKNAPHRISFFGKSRNALFQAAGVEAEQEAEAQPAWMRDEAFMLRLPWKDSEGRSMYFDLTYIIPLGAIVSGEYLRNPIGTNPVLQTVKELSQNKTFSGYKIFRESDDMDTVLADIFVHISKLGMPPIVADQVPQGYDNSGVRKMGKLSRMVGDTQDRGPNERNMYQEVFRLAGLGVQPFDLESRERALEYNRKSALQQLLVENGVLNEFIVPYVPKEEEPTKTIFDRDIKPLGR